MQSDIQAHMRRRLAGPRRAGARGSAPTAAPALNRRFAVYRNNVAASLIEAMVQRFPAVCAIVGDEFFRAMARVSCSPRRRARRCC